MNVLFKRKKFVLAIFVAPLLIVYLLIILIPLVQSFVMSFTEWDGVNQAVFNGAENYIKLFKSRDLSVAIKNSLLYSCVLTVYQVGFATLFAYIFTNIEIKFVNAFKNIYFFPVLLSVSVVGQLFISIYHGDFGLINQFMKMLGSTWRQNWLNERNCGIIAITLAEAWKGMGYHMLIIYAAMRNVPRMYYEAATLDGADKKQQFFRMTLPLTMPTIKTCIIMCFTFGFRSFEMIFLMTGGGPGNFSTTMPIMMYNAMFRLQKYGYGSAIATVIVAICISLMVIINRLTKRFDEQY